MKRRGSTRRTAGALKAAATLAALSYAGLAGFSWLRYGRPKPPGAAQADPLLDRFIPTYDVVERHHIRVAAPPAIVLAAAKEQRLFRMGPVRAIVRVRELVLGGTRAAGPQAETLIDEVQALGWRILAEEDDREIVLGAVTKPWEADVTFRGLAPEDFRAFDEPDYVKIAWTLRADPAANGGSVFRTETRATATDAGARARFRTYWSFVSPGIAAIRWLSLLPLKREAERRARQI